MSEQNLREAIKAELAARGVDELTAGVQGTLYGPERGKQEETSGAKQGFTEYGQA